jgi:hypothetical protein
MLKAVFADFIPLIAALILAAAIYTLRERHRRRTRINPPQPDLKLAEITPEPLPEPQNLHELRRQILHHATLALYLETILELDWVEPSLEPQITQKVAVAAERWQTLREYARLKYDDAAPEDWFEHYRALAAPFIREKLHAAKESHTSLVEIYNALLQDLQQSLLQSRPKQRYVPPDLLPAQAAHRTATATERNTPPALDGAQQTGVIHRNPSRDT